MSAMQPSLFDREQPAAVECHGASLASVLAALRERGATICGMEVICTSRYRLTLAWPQPRLNHEHA